MSEGSWVTASCNDGEFAIVFVFDNVIDNVKCAIMFFDNNDETVDLAPHLWVGAELLPLELDEASQRAVVQLCVHQLRDLGNMGRRRRMGRLKQAWWQLI